MIVLRLCDKVYVRTGKCCQISLVFAEQLILQDLSAETKAAAAKPDVLPTKRRLTLSESDSPDSAENIKQADDIIGWKGNVGWRKSLLLTQCGSVEVMEPDLENWVCADGARGCCY